MRRISLLLTLLVSLSIVAAAYAADVWADSIISASQGPSYSGGEISPGRSNPSAVLGPADNDGTDETAFFSLGKGGQVIIKLSKPVDEGLEIYEATWGCNPGYANETAEVYVSENGTHWIYVGEADNDDINDCYHGAGFKTTLVLNDGIGDIDGCHPRCFRYVKIVDAGVGTEGDGFDLDAIGGIGECQLKIIVEIDVKPGSDPSCFNSDGHGVIPVAIFGTEYFDVSEIDVYSLRLDGQPVERRGSGGKYMANFEDVDGDGIEDMVVHFQDMAVYTTADVWAYLTGTLMDGTKIKGKGEICIVQ